MDFDNNFFPKKLNFLVQVRYSPVRPEALMGAMWRILAWVYGSALLGVAYALGLIWFGLAPRIGPAGWSFMLYWSCGATVLAFCVGVPTFFVVVRPIARVLDRLKAGEQPSMLSLVRARRRAINLPQVLGVLAFLHWFVPLLTIPVFARFIESAPDAMSLVIAFVGTTGIGVVHATFILYVTEGIVRRHFMPKFLADGRVSRVHGARPTAIGAKIGLLFVTTAVFPIFCFGVMIIAGTADAAAAAFLGAVSLMIGVAQVSMIALSIHRPLKMLYVAMERVREGDLGVRAGVVSADQMGLVTEGFNRMVEGLQRAEFAKETFGRYVSDAVLEDILRGRVRLGGERREATIVFSDIRDFAAMSESKPPEEVVSFLNRYLDAMVDVIVEHGGTVDKFVGDAIVATFGVPVPQEDHALRAVYAAFAMEDRLVELNEELEQSGEGPIDIGIGIHSGIVVVGNIGSARKMEYTVIGDTVNTASRIEGLTKKFHTRLLISAETFEQVAEQVVARQVEQVEVKGKRKPVQVYQVSELAGTGRRDLGL